MRTHSTTFRSSSAILGAVVLGAAILSMAAGPTRAQETVVVPAEPTAPTVVVPAEPAAPAVVVPARPVTPTRPVTSGPAVPAPLKSIVKELRNGPLLIHGNFCGIGNRRGTEPIDALDAACMRHDACTRTGKLPGCACNDRLRVEATLVAQDGRTPPDVRAVATATAAAMSVLICKTGGTLAVPILPPPPR